MANCEAYTISEKMNCMRVHAFLFSIFIYRSPLIDYLSVFHGSSKCWNVFSCSVASNPLEPSSNKQGVVHGKRGRVSYFFQKTKPLQLENNNISVIISYKFQFMYFFRDSACFRSLWVNHHYTNEIHVIDTVDHGQCQLRTIYFINTLLCFRSGYKLPNRFIFHTANNCGKISRPAQVHLPSLPHRIIHSNIQTYECKPKEKQRRKTDVL